MTGAKSDGSLSFETAPMEAKSVGALPDEPGWQYEPKWDGFRCLLCRRGEKVDLRSKAGEDLTRYFPELVNAALKLKASEFLLDGEIVVPHGKAFSFDDLLQRIHPAASRVTKLSQETPALYELKDGKGSLINFDFNDGLYTIPKTVLVGYLTIGKQRVEFHRTSTDHTQGGN